MRKHYHSYKDLISSYEAININFGLLPPGIYRGFDAIQNSTTTGNIFFTHNQTGAPYVQKDGTKNNNIAIIKTQQGVVISEDEGVDLPMSGNLDSSPRFDVLVLSHEWSDTVGGSVSTFSIIEGVVGYGIPEIPNPNTKVVIGVIRVEPGGPDVSNWVWQKSPTPQYGNHDIFRTRNIWVAQQTHQFSSTPLVVTSNVLEITDDANNFYIEPTVDLLIPFIKKHLDPITDSQDRIGTTVTIINNSINKVSFYDKSRTIDESIALPDGAKYVVTSQNLGILELMPNGIIQLLEEADQWRVTAVIDNFSNVFRLATEIEDKPWGEDVPFIEAVKEVISGNLIADSKGSTLTVVGSVINNGLESTHRNIYDVFVTSGVLSIDAVETAFELGSRILLKFVASNPIVLRRGSGITKFISPIGFDYLIKEGSIIEVLQTASGLVVTQGEPYIDWILPAVSGISLEGGNGAFRYAVCPDGLIHFGGSFQVGLATTYILFELPQSLFSEMALSGIGVHQVFVPTIAGLTLNENNAMAYGIEVGETTVKFSVSGHATIGTYFNFNGVTLPYR